MNITVFGASGGIGAHLVALAAQRGHQVRAVYRTPPQDPPPSQAEVVISRTAMTSPPDLHQRLARIIVTAMKAQAAPARLIAVSTASMGPADTVMGPGPRLLFRFFRTVAVPNLGRVGKDLQAMESELAASGLDWHALRPVKLTDGPLTGKVQASDRFTMKAISRADVAWQILAIAEEPAPGPSRTPVITTGTSPRSRPAGDRPARQAPTAR
jgi:hypothetical protein